jgi:hypothetical protein
MGTFVSDLFGTQTKTDKQLRSISNSGFENRDIQKFLPPSLQQQNIGPGLSAGMQNISELLRNPGALSPNVSSAILPRLAAESETIAQNFRGIGSEQAGAAARGNAPVSIKNALASALNVAQERAQRGARRDALTSSDQLRRQDLDQTFKILDAILGFISSARGQGIQGLGALSETEAARSAARLELAGKTASAYGAGGK